MLGNFSDKAIAAKVRAMYRYRLTSADYEELMKKRSVGDVAAYLRDNTHYRTVLDQTDPASVHRGQLEALLRRLRYVQYQRLLAYNYSEKEIFRFFYMREEIGQLLALIRTFGGEEKARVFGLDEAETFSPDRQLLGHTSFDLERLEQVKSYPELRQLLGESPYGKLLERFEPDEDGQIDQLGCEREFYVYYYKKLLTLADRELEGDARKATRGAVYGRIDTEKIVQVYRLKRFFRSGEDFIRRSLLPFETPSQALIDKMIAAPDNERLHELLAEAGIIREGEERADGFIENAILRLRAKQCRWELHNSTHPVVVLHAYMTHLELELEDLINILESVRYGLPVEEMRRILTVQ